MSDSAANHTDEESFEFDCPECGTHITGEVDRCPKCGVEFVIEEVSEAECPQCHAAVPAESVKCPRCGLDFRVPEAEPAPAPAPVAEKAPPAPPEASKEEPASPDRLKDEFSDLVGRVKPLLTLAKDYDIEALAARRLIDKAVDAGKNKDVETAVRLLRECLATLNGAMGEYLDREIASLKNLAEVARKTGGDPDPIMAAAEGARTKRAEGDIQSALAKIQNGKKIAQQLTGPYMSAHEMCAALEKLVQNSERFFLDVREARKLLDDAKKAGESGDWSTMAALARQGREGLARSLPEVLRKEMHEGRQYLLEAKVQGKDVTAAVRALKEAGTAMKGQHYEDALARMAEFKALQKGP